MIYKSKNKIQNRADIFLPCWKRGLPAALDVTVVSPLQRSLVQEASVTQGHALQVAEARKIATHDQNCRSEGIVFVPLAVETLGGWSSLAVDTIKAFSRLQTRDLASL